MTIMEAINRIDHIKPNRYDQSEKIKWLNALDEKVKNEIINAHEGAENINHMEYTDETPLTTELLIPSPYDEVYLYWMEAQVDYWNGETKRYNNSIEMFNVAYSAYSNYYNRNHMPKGKKFKFF